MYLGTLAVPSPLNPPPLNFPQPNPLPSGPTQAQPHDQDDVPHENAEETGNTQLPFHEDLFDDDLPFSPSQTGFACRSFRSPSPESPLRLERLWEIATPSTISPRAG